MTVPSQTGLGPNGAGVGLTGPNGANLGGVVNASPAAGATSLAILRIPANVAAGETVVIGGSTFRVAAVATDSTKTCANGELNNTNPTCELFTMTAHGLIAGDLIRVQNEIMMVSLKLNANQVKLLRGVSGTTIATHADGQSIFTESSPGSGSIAVGLNATFTPTAFTPAFVADLNNFLRCSEQIGAIQISVNEVIIYAANRDRKGVQTPLGTTSNLGTTETLAGASNAFDTATLAGGALPGQYAYISRAPVANEVTAGVIHFIFPFAVNRVKRPKIYTTASGALATWDGAVTISGNRVTLDNTGASDWATTHTIEVEAFS